MKRVLIGSVAALLVVLGAYCVTHNAARAADAKKAETLTGEVLDLACYADHGAHGEKHKACAIKCLEGGSPVGLLVGDKAYLIAAHGDSEAYQQIRKMGAEKVKVTGVVTENGGLRAINIEKVAKAE